MPPAVDTFVFTRQRERNTLRRFLDTYVDREASAHQGYGGLEVEPVDGTVGERHLVALRSLEHIVALGIDEPRYAFFILLPSLRADVTDVWLCFTRDNAMVLGIGIEDEGMLPEHEVQARLLLTAMMRDYGGVLGYIGVDQPPPETEAKFRLLAVSPLTQVFVEAIPTG